MRHGKRGRKLGRNSSHRKAMIRNMVRSLFEHERIVTTREKAKEAQPFAEKIITLAKEKNLHNVRLVSDRLRCVQRFQPAPAPVIEEPDDFEDEKPVVELREPPTRRWDVRIVEKLFNEIGPRFKDRPGGYTRILTKTQFRRGDGASRVIFELVERGDGDVEAEPAEKGKKGSSKED